MIDLSDMFRLPCVIMRGGTSKAIFLKENDLPADRGLRDKIILALFGSPDVRQIDGLAGADPLTSKLAIIGPPTRPDADIDYTFGQVSINDSVIDYSGNCGNISSAVGPFAIDESFVRAVEPVTTVRIHNTNTGKILKADVLVKDGKARVTGNCKIDGVPGASAKILMDFSDTAGSSTGRLLPTGNATDTIETSRGPIKVSIVDCANPCVFVRAEDLGMTGTETPKQVDGDKELLNILEEIRARTTVILGKADTVEEATKNSPAFPMVAFVTQAKDYIDFTSGKTIKKEQVDFVSRLMFMQVLHKTYAGTGTVCTGAAAKIPGTIINQLFPDIDRIDTIRIGHPAGVITVEAAVKDGKVERAAFERTARRLLEGYAYIEKVTIKGK
jgi:2-methylaconitate cis-trans-isomerase PrpF